MLEHVWGKTATKEIIAVNLLGQAKRYLSFRMSMLTVLELRSGRLEISSKTL